MRSDRGHHSHRVERRIADQQAIVSCRLGHRIAPGHAGETIFINVANPAKLRTLILRKIAQQVRAPVTAANDADVRRFHSCESIASI